MVEELTAWALWALLFWTSALNTITSLKSAFFSQEGAYVRVRSGQNQCLWRHFGYTMSPENCSVFQLVEKVPVVCDWWAVRADLDSTECKAIVCQHKAEDSPLIVFQPETSSHLLDDYFRPSDFRYFFDFLSPILDAFFFTVSSDRPNFPATFAVELFGKSFLSKATSLLDHKPLISFFFAITWFLSPN